MLGSFLLGIDPGPFGRAMIDLALLRPGSRKQEAEVCSIQNLHTYRMRIKIE